MFRVRLHFRYLDLARFNEPAVENFQKQIALKIDKDWLGTCWRLQEGPNVRPCRKGCQLNESKKITISAILSLSFWDMSSCWPGPRRRALKARGFVPGHYRF